MPQQISMNQYHLALHVNAIDSVLKQQGNEENVTGDDYAHNHNDENDAVIDFLKRIVWLQYWLTSQ